MKISNKKFVLTFLDKTIKSQKMIRDKKVNKTQKLFEFIHELNGVAATYGFEQIAMVTKYAHELIYTINSAEKNLDGATLTLYKSYLNMLEMVFEEGAENHSNTKECLHLLDDFKFHLEYFNVDQAA